MMRPLRANVSLMGGLCVALAGIAVLNDIARLAASPHRPDTYGRARHTIAGRSPE
jgi:hypothetical protein